MLHRVTSVNHNVPLKPPTNCDTKNRAANFCSAHIMRPWVKHLQRGGRGGRGVEGGGGGGGEGGRGNSAVHADELIIFTLQTCV